MVMTTFIQILQTYVCYFIVRRIQNTYSFFLLFKDIETNVMYCIQNLKLEIEVGV